MFLIGTLIGIGVETSNTQNELNESVRQWGQINGELLLLGACGLDFMHVVPSCCEKLLFDSLTHSKF